MTSRTLAAALATILALPLALTAQTPAALPPAAAPALAPETAAALDNLTGRLLLHGQAYEYDRQLADGIGPRLTGSANYVKAVDWAIAEFTRLGLKNVHKESWTIPATWEPAEFASAHILEPHIQRLHLESEGWSPSTPESGIRGPVFHLPNLNSADAIRAEAANIKGSIILIDSDSHNSGEPASEGTIYQNHKLLADLGALAILSGTGTVQNAVSVGGPWDGAILPLPTAVVGQEDTLLLRRLLEKGPVTIKFRFINAIREHVSIDNVVADLPGRDLPKEIVLIGGHLDSWHPGTGAQDNGTGAASVVAIAQAVTASGRAPRRTLRFALFGGEEEGLLGSQAFTRAHQAEMPSYDAVLITDTGSDAPKGWMTLGRADLTAALAPIKPLLAGLGADGISNYPRIAFGTDDAGFLARGVPALVLWTSFDKYMALHHKPSDTFDKVSQRDLSLGATVVGLTAYAIADSPQPFAPHLTPDQVEDQMKKAKIFDEFDDMRKNGWLY